MKITQTDNEIQTERERVGSFAYLIIYISVYSIIAEIRGAGNNTCN